LRSLDHRAIVVHLSYNALEEPVAGEFVLKTRLAFDTTHNNVFANDTI
jgi:hypothetical protein